MTIQEAHISFKMKMEGYETLTYRDWHVDEIDYWLKEAELTFIKERFNGYKGLSFEQGQKRIEDLRNLLKDVHLSVTLTPQGVLAKQNAYYFELPDDYYLCDEEQVVFNVNGSVTDVISGITECVGDSYDSYINDPFSGHRYKLGKAKPLRTFVGNYAELITDGAYSVKTYLMRYLKRPQVISYSLGLFTELAEITHDEIVQKAVTLAIARVVGDPNKYQIALTEETKNLN